MPIPSHSHPHSWIKGKLALKASASVSREQTFFFSYSTLDTHGHARVEKVYLS